MSWAMLLILLMCAAVFAFFELPLMLVSPRDLLATVPHIAGAKPSPSPTAVDLLQARNSVRTAAVALIAGLGAALATGFAGRTYYLSRRGQLDDRYMKTLDCLGKPQEAIRVSAIAELECIARERPDRHRQVMQVLADYIRSHRRGEDHFQAPSSIQTACTALAQRRKRYDRRLVLDLSGADLRGVSMPSAPLRGAILRDADLRGASLRVSDLSEAILTNAQAQSARLDGALLEDAHLDGALLQGATLDAVRGAGAAFDLAHIESTFMRGADLRESTGLQLDEGQVIGAVTDQDTKLLGKRPATRSLFNPLRRLARKRVGRSAEHTQRVDDVEI